MSKRYPISLEIAHGIFARIDEYTLGDYAAIGVTQHDFIILTQQAHWRMDQLRVVIRTFNSLLFGTLEIMGVPKQILPAEYVGSLIAAVIAPANQMLACAWLAAEHNTGVGALELSNRRDEPAAYQQASAQQLFAIVAALMGDRTQSNEVRVRFREKFGLQQERMAIQ